MKKVILLLSVFALVFTSCGSDDNNNTAQDPIIGTWKLTGSYDTDVSDLDPCDTNTTLSFNADGTITGTIVAEGAGGPADCITFTVTTGTWTSTGTSTYNLSVTAALTGQPDIMFTEPASLSGNVLTVDPGPDRTELTKQ